MKLRHAYHRSIHWWTDNFKHLKSMARIVSQRNYLKVFYAIIRLDPILMIDRHAWCNMPNKRPRDEAMHLKVFGFSLFTQHYGGISMRRSLQLQQTACCSQSIFSRLQCRPDCCRSHTESLRDGFKRFAICSGVGCAMPIVKRQFHPTAFGHGNSSDVANITDFIPLFVAGNWAPFFHVRNPHSLRISHMVGAWKQVWGPACRVYSPIHAWGV